jgi:hypothetical protein
MCNIPTMIVGHAWFLGSPEDTISAPKTRHFPGGSLIAAHPMRMFLRLEVTPERRIIRIRLF